MVERSLAVGNVPEKTFDPYVYDSIKGLQIGSSLEEIIVIFVGFEYNADIPSSIESNYGIEAIACENEPKANRTN
ncbi:MAG: hypothetical protein AAF514_20205 [Verrucomicrobiota bacterium]